MFLIILATLVLVALAALTFLDIKQKTLIMSALVVGLVLANLVSEFSTHWVDTHPNWDSGKVKLISFSLDLYKNPQSKTLFR